MHLQHFLCRGHHLLVWKGHACVRALGQKTRIMNQIGVRLLYAHVYDIIGVYVFILSVLLAKSSHF